MSATKKFLALVLCIALCISCVPMTASAARDFSFENELADSLNALNLFKGTGSSYALESPLTRPDSVIMLLRLNGKLSDAKAYSKTHPFTDVPSYADLYISYAKDNGLAYGISATEFGTANVTAAGYLTFVLRALGYTDKGGKDFTWDNPYTLADEVGILPSCVDINNFLRADVVSISYAALAANMADGSGTLADKLIADEVFTQEAFEANYDPDAFTTIPEPPEVPEKPVLDSESVYAKCSSSVFRIDVYDADGIAFASGSGFFIDENGTAVTNYHVIDAAHSATATLTNGKAYDILGVYDYDAENDWAVIQVNGSGFDYMTIGDKSTIVGGAKVYALGSPLGLDDTFSDGMISNANRVVDGVTYIQISAPISNGSSGGALINKYGEVIGICSAGFVDGQNLNLALPITCIEGYSRAGIITLPELFPAQTQPDVDAGARQQLAYDVLTATIADVQNGVDSDGVSPVYSEQFDSEIGVWFTDYYNNQNVEVCTCYIPAGEELEWWSFLHLTADGTFFEYNINVYYSGTYDSVFRGEIIIDPQSEVIQFNDYTFYTDDYDATTLVDLSLEMAIAMLVDSLYYTDAFFLVANEDLGYPFCSTADFGFAY